MTLVMPALLIVPDPLRTKQVCDGVKGCVLTVTEKAALLSSRVPKTKPPLPLKLRSSLPLSCSTRPEPLNPVTVPPTVYFALPVMGQPDRASTAVLTTAMTSNFTKASVKSYNFLHCPAAVLLGQPPSKFAPRRGCVAIHCKLDSAFDILMIGVTHALSLIRPNRIVRFGALPWHHDLRRQRRYLGSHRQFAAGRRQRTGEVRR